MCIMAKSRLQDDCCLTSLLPMLPTQSSTVRPATLQRIIVPSRLNPKH
jgi:hypothetical protein